MACVSLTWKEFLTDMNQFLQLSKSIGDSWQLFKKDDEEGNTFLIYKKKVQIKHRNKQSSIETGLEDDLPTNTYNVGLNTNETLQLEYHIVYSISYQVPVLYLRIYRGDGSSADLEDVWSIFSGSKKMSRSDMLAILTQTEHPILFKPFYSIHPCRTAELLAQRPKSTNKILTFISIMGPYIQLHLDNKYGLDC